jgi:Flp pilus assembly protein TadG
VRLGSIQRARTRRDGQRGGTTVEFALVLPVLMAVLFGMLEGGRLIVSRSMLSQAAIRGARVASITSTTTASQVEAAVISTAPLLGLAASNIDVIVNGVTTESAAFGTRAAGSNVGVIVRYTFTPKLPVPFATKSFTARSEVVMP